jgi:hypothetical protein
MDFKEIRATFTGQTSKPSYGLPSKPKETSENPRGSVKALVQMYENRIRESSQEAERASVRNSSVGRLSEDKFTPYLTLQSPSEEIQRNRSQSTNPQGPNWLSNISESSSVSIKLNKFEPSIQSFAKGFNQDSNKKLATKINLKLDQLNLEKIEEKTENTEKIDLSKDFTFAEPQEGNLEKEEEGKNEESIRGRKREKRKKNEKKEEGTFKGLLDENGKETEKEIYRRNFKDDAKKIAVKNENFQDFHKKNQDFAKDIRVNPEILLKSEDLGESQLKVEEKNGKELEKEIFHKNDKDFLSGYEMDSISEKEKRRMERRKRRELKEKEKNEQALVKDLKSEVKTSEEIPEPLLVASSISPQDPEKISSKKKRSIKSPKIEENNREVKTFEEIPELFHVSSRISAQDPEIISSKKKRSIKSTKIEENKTEMKTSDENPEPFLVSSNISPQDPEKISSKKKQSIKSTKIDENKTELKTSEENPETFHVSSNISPQDPENISSKKKRSLKSPKIDENKTELKTSEENPEPFLISSSISPQHPEKSSSDKKKTKKSTKIEEKSESFYIIEEKPEESILSLSPESHPEFFQLAKPQEDFFEVNPKLQVKVFEENPEEKDELIFFQDYQEPLIQETELKTFTLNEKKEEKIPSPPNKKKQTTEKTKEISPKPNPKEEILLNPSTFSSNSPKNQPSVQSSNISHPFPVSSHHSSNASEKDELVLEAPSIKYQKTSSEQLTFENPLESPLSSYRPDPKQLTSTYNEFSYQKASSIPNPKLISSESSPKIISRPPLGFPRVKTQELGLTEILLSEIDVTCINCYEVLHPDEIDSHSLKCLKPNLELNDSMQADMRIRKLLRAISNRKVSSVGEKYNFYCLLEEYSLAILEKTMVKFK